MFRKFTLPCSSLHMFHHMECSTAARSRGRCLGGWSSTLVLPSLCAGEQWAPKWVPVASALVFNRLSTQFAWFSDPFAHGLLKSPSHGHLPPVFNPAALGAASPPCLFSAGSSWVVGLAHLLFPFAPNMRLIFVGQHCSGSTLPLSLQANCAALSPQDQAGCCRGFCARESSRGVCHWTLGTF